MIRRNDPKRKYVEQEVRSVGEIKFPHVINRMPSTDTVVIKVLVSKRQVKWVYMDRGSSCEVIYEHYFLKLKPLIRAQRVYSKITLVGFSRGALMALGISPFRNHHMKRKPGSKDLVIDRNPFGTEHKLNEYKHIDPIKQNQAGLAPERSAAACKEVDELTKARIL
ncbi:hypothetical protein Tco_0877471 [Tanacetum coccineum]|uniref:DUF2235 domain-containing protein n=1 Tax=Tanacetum coccineum TaxID=301880 RepID=A0ABQ5BV70_9ASTR